MKNSNKNSLMLQLLIFTFVIGLGLTYITYFPLLKLGAAIKNPTLHEVFSIFFLKLPESWTRRHGVITLFSGVIFLVVGYFIKKYYYEPRLKK